MTGPQFDPSSFELPPEGTLCDICRKREATGGTIYRDGREAVNHCDACEHQVPVGQGSWSRVSASDQPSPRDPNATCDNCGTRGTVGRVTRRGKTIVVKRFCRACWPSMRARAEEEQRLISEQWMSAARSRGHSPASRSVPMSRPESITWESRDWSDSVEFISLMLRLSAGSVDADAFAELAAAILEQADEMDGPMPPEIEAFVERYGRPAV